VAHPFRHGKDFRIQLGKHPLSRALPGSPLSPTRPTAGAR
jgi:hypothetical protein